MGVYIKGMEMPSIDLEWRIIRGQDGKWYAIDVNAETSDGEWHEIVPVPPHGRLIDASEKIRVQMYDDMTEDYHIAEMTIDDLLSQGWVEADVPTIIEAEEGKT